MSVTAADLGVISFTDRLTQVELGDYASRVESLGYGSMWIPELMGREPFTTASWLLARTGRLVIASGIANVYARDALTAAQTAHTLAELSGGRFALGLGVSHPPAAEMRGHEWIAPGRKMRAYLEGIRGAQVQSVPPAKPAPIYVAAHGPVLLRVAAELADGALGYLLPPSHGERARAVLGPKPLLTVLPVVVDDDRERALATARKGLAIYMGLPAYHRAWESFSFGAGDWEGGGSERLVDSVGAFGDEKRVRRRIQDYLDAGTSTVLVSPLHSDSARPGGPPTRLEALHRLAG